MARKQTAFADRFPTWDSPVLIALATNVRRHRELKDWSQTLLATEIGVDQNAISLLENARANPTLRMVEAIALAFGVSVSEILDPPFPSLKKI